MGDDSDFEQLIASLGSVLAETADDLILGGGLRVRPVNHEHRPKRRMRSMTDAA
jgi:hypothetical protein